jgi:hypothetical protein
VVEADEDYIPRSKSYENKETEIDKDCSTGGGMRKTYKIWVGKTEGKRLLKKPRHRWVDIIRMDIRAIEEP